MRYYLEDNGIPLPYFNGGFNNGMYYGMGMGMAPTGMGMAPMRPVCPQSSIPIAIVGDKVEPEKPDKWTEYEAECGTKFYHNPAKNETTWEKPEDFDKQKMAGQPAPPTEPKPTTKQKCKYVTDRKGWI